MDLLSKKDFGTHLAVAAWLRISFSGLLVVCGVLVGSLLVGLGAATRDAVANRTLGTTGAWVGSVLVVLALPGLVAGIGLLKRASWSRVMALVLSAVDLMVFPIGTVLAGYTVFVLSQQAAIDAFGACCSIEEGRVRAIGA